jgi:hypothetical protein
MPPKYESVRLNMRKDQLIRLNLLRAAIAEKMKKEMSLHDIVEKIIDDFLDSK